MNGWGRIQAGLSCVVDVNDEERHRLALRAVAGSLEPVLGKGEEKVVR